MNKVVEYIISIPKSLYFCFRYFKFIEAIKLPVIVRYNISVVSYKGQIELWGGYFAQVRIGFGTVGCYDKKYQRTIWDCNGVVRFYGKAFIGSGSKVIVESKGLIEFGDNFNNTAGMTLICSERINFGKDVLIGWDTLIMDSDFHKVINLETTDTYKSTDAITIGNHVWVGCKVTILKGSSIGDDSIVASNACVVKAEKEKAVLLAGSPAKIKKRSVSWNL